MMYICTHVGWIYEVVGLVAVMLIVAELDKFYHCNLLFCKYHSLVFSSCLEKKSLSSPK